MAREEQSAAQLFQLFFSKRSNLLQTYLLVNRTTVMKRTLSLLNTMKAAKPRQDAFFGGDHFLKMGQFELQQMVNDENKLFGYCQSKYVSSLSKQAKKVFLFVEYVQELLLFSLSQQFVVQGQQLQLIVSPELEWKIIIETVIFKSLSFIEGLDETIFQVLIDGVLKYLHVFLVQGLLETAICQALKVLFKIKNG